MVCVFTIIAERELPFYYFVSRKLELHNISCYFLFFSHPAYALARKLYPSINSTNVFDPPDACIDKDVFAELLRLSSDNVLLHQSQAFYQSPLSVQREFYNYLHHVYSYLSRILQLHSPTHKIFICQELGAFTLPYTCHQLTQVLPVSSVFFEGSLIPNSYQAIINTTDDLPVLQYQPPHRSSQKSYKTWLHTPIVPPYKDQRLVRTRTSRLTSLAGLIYPFSRFIQKAKSKLLGQKQQYDRIFVMLYKSFLRHISFNSYSYYSLDQFPASCLYFPLHSDDDFSLTIRNRSYLDQTQLLKLLVSYARSLNTKVILKQHPTRPYSLGRLPSSIAQYIVFAHPSVSSLDISRIALCTISICSKAGLESLLHRLPTIVLGNTSYSHLLPSTMKTLTSLSSFHINQVTIAEEHAANIYSFLLNRTSDGQLYDISHDNISLFSMSLISLLQSCE